MYVRTKDNKIYEVLADESNYIYKGTNMIKVYDEEVFTARDISKNEIDKEADTIEELCEEFKENVEVSK